MDAPIHNTNLKKRYSDIFETNSLFPLNLRSNDVVQPTVELTPDLVILTKDSNGVIINIPANKNFFITNISIGTLDDYSYVEFTADFDDQLKIVLAPAKAGVAGSNFIIIPGRGIKVKSGTSITFTINGVALANCSIVGYYGSDRA